MEDNIMGNGIKIRCKDMEFSHGQQVEYIRVNTSKIKNMDLEILRMKMDLTMKEIGHLANEMEKAFLLMTLDLKFKEDGGKIY
jgi:hypothetical protein